jgi:hypothetical protein
MRYEHASETETTEASRALTDAIDWSKTVRGHLAVLEPGEGKTAVFELNGTIDRYGTPGPEVIQDADGRLVFLANGFGGAGGYRMYFNLTVE